MMTLPKFIDPDPSTETLRLEQSRLQQQADRMLEATNIMDVFSKYGTVSDIGGSYAYGLMVYPDLDFAVVASELKKEAFASLLSELAVHNYVRKIATADTVNFPSVHAGRPKGYWIGLEIPFEADRWGIDCWLQQPDWISESEDPYLERLKDLDSTAKDAILAIKYHLIRQGLYGKQYFSSDVYDAVLDKGIYSLEGFFLAHS